MAEPSEKDLRELQQYVKNVLDVFYSLDDQREVPAPVRLRIIDLGELLETWESREA